MKREKLIVSSAALSTIQERLREQYAGRSKNQTYGKYLDMYETIVAHTAADATAATATATKKG